MLVCSVFLLIATASAVPQFHVNLDLPEGERWNEIVNFYKTSLPEMMKYWMMEIKEGVGEAGVQQWLDALQYPKHILAEMQGVVNYAGSPHVTLDALKTWNAMYEMNHPTFCTAILAANKNGTVTHGRNMDYGFLWEKDGKPMDLEQVTFDTIFTKNGKRLMTSTGWPGHVGIQTGMRFNGWTVQINLRPNTYKENLIGAMKGGLPHGIILRHYLETIPDYDVAVEKFYKASFAAPCYLIMAGREPFQGTILTMDRNGKHDPLTPKPYKLAHNQWHLAQTNEDLTSVPLDLRRPFIETMLAFFSPKDVTDSFVLQQMRMPGAFNTATKFTEIYTPFKNTHNTFLANDFAFLEHAEPPHRSDSFHRKSGSGWHRFLAPAPAARPHKGPPQGRIMLTPDDFAS